MRYGVFLAALLGTALAVWLIARIGIMPVLQSAGAVGVGGFIGLCALYFTVTLPLGGGWRVLVPRARGGGLVTFLLARQLRDTVGDILPFSQLGGILAGCRAVILRGMTPPLAFASATVDLTTEAMAQMVYVLIGLFFCMAWFDNASPAAPVIQGVAIGLAVFVPCIVGFVLVQKKGSGFAERMAARFLPGAVKHTAAFGVALRAIYDAPLRLAASAFLHLVAWTVSGFWTWVALRLMGAPLSFTAVIAIEAILCAVRSMLVFVPAAIGVQEAGYAALMPLFGLPAEAGLALSLLRRARDIVVGVPVLLIWQAVEGRRVFAPVTDAEPGA